MPGSSFGEAFRVATFGESHGGGVGVIVEGVTPGLPLAEGEIQQQLDRRKPGQSAVTTSRAEQDEVHILSGVFEGQATGTPLMMVLYNKDMRPEAYREIKDLFRPGHADFTYLKKYGLRDHRGAGRASGRETAGRVAAGAVAMKQLDQRGVHIIAYTKRAAGIECAAVDLDQIEKNPMRAADARAAEKMVEAVTALARQGESTGGIVECVVRGVAPGLGEPVFDKLDARLAQGMLSLGAVKGIEFGTGFDCVDMGGSHHNDWMNKNGFLTNHAGGILGGLSNGNDIVFRIAVKPTSSVSVPQETVDIHNNETPIVTEGRHDPCICPRIVPVVEGMTALVLEDLYKRQAALHG